MNLHRLLQRRASEKRPVRVVLVGAGKFGSMYLSQARRTPGIQILAVADLAPERARASLARVGWAPSSYSAKSLDEALRDATTFVTDDAERALAHPATEVVIDATGNPAAGIAHVLACCKHRKHIVMVNVEADALAGPLLAQRATEAGIVYSLAYGDQPALICELVDWARTAGLRVVAAGKGTKYLPAYHASTPKTVWGHYGFSDETVERGDFNARFAVATQSPRQPVAAPVGSRRSATLATLIPSSRPMRWLGLYIAAYSPEGSVTMPYSWKQRRTYSWSAANVTYTPQRRSRNTGRPSRSRLEITSTCPA